MERFDVAVIGAGFGGIAAALSLAERGRSVVLFEALNYPGGCASTFRRHGHAFESGATLVAGLGPRQPFARWIARHGLDVPVTRPDPVVVVRTPTDEIPVHADRAAFVDALCARPGAPIPALRRFFDLQKRAADPLWALLDAPEVLPPLGPSALAHHARRVVDYVPAVRFAGRPLRAAIDAAGLARWGPFEAWATSLTQITVQCGPDEAEAPFALSSLDYPWRGAGHVEGGVGRLAEALVDAFARLGGQVRYASRVDRLARDGDGWRLEGPRGGARAASVIANALPADVAALLGGPVARWPRLQRLDAGVRGGWGAAMLYLALRLPPDAPPGPMHFDLVADPSAPYVDGNHAFVSFAPAVPGQARTATVSTHLALRDLPADAVADRVAAVQDRMRSTVKALLPAGWFDVTLEMTASPRTFQRFTRRGGGFVGGVPRRAGMGQYRDLWPVEVEHCLWLVGDTVFPGQSTLATAVGGLRVAEAVERRARA